MPKNKDAIYYSLPLGKLLAMVTKPYFGTLSGRLEKKLGVEKNFSVLMMIEHKERCTQQFLSNALQIDKVSMVKIIDDFSKKGWVKRVQNENDRREYFVELTAKGSNIMPQIHKGVEEINEIAFKGFKQKEKEKFYETVMQLYRNLEHLPSDHVIIYKTKKKNL